MEMAGRLSQSRSAVGDPVWVRVGQGEVRLSANALKVLEKRYLAKDEQGRVAETPEQMFARVARNVAQVEMVHGGEAGVAKAFEEFYGIMARLEFLPNSPTLMNAGRELQQLSACFVLPIGDSMEEIFETVKQAAMIHKTGGGTGFSFSRLRPKADMVRTTGGVASGPVSFMKVFNHATEAVKQGGTRRGANMGILRVDHPDILEFITCKTDSREVTNFNISVAITDTFMEALEKDGTYDLINPHGGQVVRSLKAREVADKIAYQAWMNGEPGLFFIDVTNRTNPTPHVAAIEATNPCGEQPLLPYESCNLGSVNLERHLTRTNGRPEIHWEHLECTVRASVRFLDDVIDANRYPLPETEEVTRANRKIGLGVMGFSRMLFKLGIPYDSEQGVETGRKVMKFIKDVGYDESRRLARQRGVYRHWKGSLHDRRGEPLRNSYVTTVAPTGTLSMIADTSGGCEPEFSLIWYKNVMDQEHLPYVLEYFIEVAKDEGFWQEGLMDQILANHGSVRGLAEVPPRWQQVFSVSHDIGTEWHIRMQAAFQESSDSAVSKTINLPKEATVEDVQKSYRMAYRLGCKGITVYRDGSRQDQVMNVGVSKKGLSQPETAPGGNGAGLSKVKPHPVKRLGATISRETPFGTAHITMNNDEEGPAEVFITIGKAGSDVMGMAEGYGRCISLYLRTPSSLSRKEKVRVLAEQLKGIGGSRSVGFGKERVSSLPDAIAQVLAEHWLAEPGAEGEKEGGEKPVAYSNGGNGKSALALLTSGNLCRCGMSLVKMEGCEKCFSCGYSSC